MPTPVALSTRKLPRRAFHKQHRAFRRCSYAASYLKTGKEQRRFGGGPQSPLSAGPPTGDTENRSLRLRPVADGSAPGRVYRDTATETRREIASPRFQLRGGAPGGWEEAARGLKRKERSVVQAPRPARISERQAALALHLHPLCVPTFLFVGTASLARKASPIVFHSMIEALAVMKTEHAASHLAGAVHLAEWDRHVSSHVHLRILKGLIHS
jgi:hypothetical protein